MNIEVNLLKQDMAGELRDRDAALAVVQKYNCTVALGGVDTKIKNYQDEIMWKLERGWTEADAQTHTCLTGLVGNSIAKAMSEKSNRYNASTYGLCTALHRGAVIQQETPLSFAPQSLAKLAPLY